jgi:uncharacterized protein
MMRKWFHWAIVVVIASLSLTSGALAADANANQSSKAVANAKATHIAKPHRIVIQVDQNDPAMMNLALN